MITLGVDLSANPADTAACRLHWLEGRGTDKGEPPLVGLDDDKLLHAMSEVDRVGMDCPFGWPDAFVQAVGAWTDDGRWTGGTDREPLRFRITDLKVKEFFKSPLSVSSDRIGSTAMRCAHLLQRHADEQEVPLDRVNGPILEVYPAAALHAWNLKAKGYKTGDHAGQVRHEILQGLVERAALDLCAATMNKCRLSDHALDALVASLVARAAEIGLVHAAESEDLDKVGREGWIYVPLKDSLEKLRQ